LLIFRISADTPTLSLFASFHFRCASDAAFRRHFSMLLSPPAAIISFHAYAAIAAPDSLFAAPFHYC